MNTAKLTKLFNVVCFSVITTVSFSACEKDDYESFTPPALGNGECQYHKKNFTSTQSVAQTEMDRVAAIFEDSTIGSYAVEVFRKEVYVSQTKNGQPHRYGFQIVFSCDRASIVREESSRYSSRPEANEDLEIAWNILLQGRYSKPVTKGISEFSWEECDTCSDYVCDTCSETTCDTCYDEYDEPYDCNCTTDYWDCNCGYEYYDCNCETYYEYSWWIEYIRTYDPPGTTPGGAQGRYAADGTILLNNHQKFVQSEINKIIAKTQTKAKKAAQRSCPLGKDGRDPHLQLPKQCGSKKVKNSSIVPDKKSIYYILKGSQKVTD